VAEPPLDEQQSYDNLKVLKAQLKKELKITIKRHRRYSICLDKIAGLYSFQHCEILEQNGGFPDEPSEDEGESE